MLGRHHSSGGDGKDVWASIAEAEGSKHGYGALDDLDPKGEKHCGSDVTFEKLIQFKILPR